MKTKSLVVSLSLLVLILVFSSAGAFALIVDFTDMNRGPSTTLQINGVTISPGNFPNDVGSMPATVSGIGLGSSTIGGVGTVDRVEDAMGYMRESLSLMVSGTINSVSITPYFSVVGSKDDIFIPFDMSYKISGSGFPAYVRLNDSSPITLHFSLYPPFDGLQIGLQAEESNFSIQKYLAAHPGATVQFGFAITSLDYTPADVPETSTVTLFGIGLLAICLLRRKIPA